MTLFKSVNNLNLYQILTNTERKEWLMFSVPSAAASADLPASSESHGVSLQAIRKDNTAPQSDSSVCHEWTPSACPCPSSRWCMCVTLWGWRCGFIQQGYVCADICPHAFTATWLGYCFIMYILHIYITSVHRISALHALLRKVMCVRFSWVHFEVTVYWRCSCLTQEDIHTERM